MGKRGIRKTGFLQERKGSEEEVEWQEKRGKV